MPEQTENCRAHTLPSGVCQHSLCDVSVHLDIATTRTDLCLETKFPETTRLSTLKDTPGRKVYIPGTAFSRRLMHLGVANVLTTSEIPQLATR